MDAIIGHTGFVGGHLARQHQFDHSFNSSNIHEIAAAEFDTVVCAAAPGSMFEANNFPDDDRAKIQALIDSLSQVKTGTFVLISSIAVLAQLASGEDEGAEAFEEKLAYGRHRRALEAFCSDHFDRCLIVRLPALFGYGLRKNFIFDLLNPVPTLLSEDKLNVMRTDLPSELVPLLEAVYAPDPVTGMHKIDRAALAVQPERAALETYLEEAGLSATSFHNRETTYQYYNLDRIWPDINTAHRAGLDVVHLATEPQTTARIYRRLLGHRMPDTNASPRHEDMHTRHADQWGCNGHYLENADVVLEQIASFFKQHKTGRA